MIDLNEGGAKLPPFFTLNAYQSIDSTSAEARKLADLSRSEGQLVWALKQNSGVGRRGREWSSPEGNLYCSLLLRPGVSATEGAKLSFLVAVALYNAIDQYLPDTAKMTLKWPNDVLINSRKTAGILLESKSNLQNKLDWLVVGTGVNVTTYPKTTDGLQAISINEAGGSVKIEDLLIRYACEFLFLYDQWKQHGFGAIRQQWLERAGGIGSIVTVKLAHDQFQGIFNDIDESGALVLTLSNGSTKLVTAGEVFFA